MKLYPYQQEIVNQIRDGKMKLIEIPRGFGRRVIYEELKKPEATKFADGSEIHGLPRENFA